MATALTEEELRKMVITEDHPWYDEKFKRFKETMEKVMKTESWKKHVERRAKERADIAAGIFPDESED